MGIKDQIVEENLEQEVKEVLHYERFWLKIIFFICITFLWSWVFLLPKILASYSVITIAVWLDLLLGGLATFGPTIGGLVMLIAFEKDIKLRDYFKRKFKTNYNKIWLLPTLLLTPLLAGIAFLISFLAFGYTLEENYYNIGFFVGAVVIAFFVGGPLGEELGWRGYALDKLQQKQSPLVSSLILGIIWGVWHLPLHFIDGTTQEFIPIWAFLLITIVLSLFYTWLYNITNGNLLVAILFHWSTNIAGAVVPYWQLGLINGQMSDNLVVPTFGMLIGFGINLTVAILIVVVWKMYVKKLPQYLKYIYSKSTI